MNTWTFCDIVIQAGVLGLLGLLIAAIIVMIIEE